MDSDPAGRATFCLDPPRRNGLALPHAPLHPLVMDAIAFTALQNEVAKLREQVRLLRRALFVSDAEEGHPLFARLRCHSIQLEDPKGEDDVLVQIGADERGGRIEIWGRGEGAAAEIGVGEHGAGEVIIFDSTPHRRIELGVDEKGSAYTTVFRTDGKPGALLKGMADSASIAATGPDGKARAAMIANDKDFGEIILTSREHQRVNIKGLETGGLIALSGPQKGAKSFLGVTPDGPSLMLGLGDNAPSAAIIVSPKESALSLNAKADGLPAIRLVASEPVAFIEVTHRKDGASVSATTVPGGATLAITNTAGFPIADFDSIKGNGRLRLYNATGQTAATLGAFGDGAYFALLPGAEDGSSKPAFAVDATPASSTLLMHQAGQPVVQISSAQAHTAIVLRSATEGRPYIQLSTTPDAQFVALMQEENIALAAIRAKPDGATFIINSELGIPRVALGNSDDGGALVLSWGGRTGVTIAAAELGGLVLVNDSEGKLNGRLPAYTGDANEEDDGGDDSAEENPG